MFYSISSYNYLAKEKKNKKEKKEQKRKKEKKWGYKDIYLGHNVSK